MIVGLVDKEKAIDIEGIVVWRKLYRKKLFDAIRFPEGAINEDILTSHKLIYKATRIYCIADRLYFYRKRRGSISHSRMYQNEAPEFEAKLQRYNELVSFGYPEEKAKQQLRASALRHCGKAINTNSLLYKYASDIVNTIERTPNDFSVGHQMTLA